MIDTSEFSILIVDDEKPNLKALSSILEDGHTVYVAKSGHEALKRAVEDKPDLILLDIVLPDMNGFEVLSELKKNEATFNIPVIFITGLDNVENEEKGFFLGAVDYITKPFHASVVKARVETHLKIVSQMRTIERFGLTDALTQIPNRLSFDTQINIEWSRAVRNKTPISLLMMDVDKFKNYNDKFGHPQGDVLLKAISKVFITTLKRATDLVFRWGGEEFAVILPNTRLQGALETAEILRANVEAAEIPCPRFAQPTRVTISIGAASTTPSQESSISDFISEADSALYTAKETGRNKVCGVDVQ